MNKRIFPKLNMQQTRSAVKSIRKTDEHTSGVIQTIMDILQVAKQQKQPVTVQETAEILKGMFPERYPEAMRTTVRVQLSRLPNERKFRIKKVRDGRNVRYSAA